MSIDVSVIIPLYNGQEYIIDCLKALENQTFKDFEVIIVDDCSSDNSYDLVDSYRNNISLNIVLVKNKKNMGPGASRNHALDIAKGKWIAFCDADDYYSPDYLDEMLTAIKTDGADIVFCNYMYVDKNGNKKQADAISNLKTICKTKDDWIAFSQMSLWRMVTNAELFSNIRMPEIYHCEDAAFIPALMSRTEKYTAVDKPLYNYCLHRNSASVKRPSSKVCYEMLSAYNYIKCNTTKENEKAIEFISIMLILYGCTLIAYKAKMPQDEIKRIVYEFEKERPNWFKNTYLTSVGKKKKWYLKNLRKKNWTALKIFSELHYYAVHFLAR